LTVNQLAEPFPITLQAVSKHLKVLERAGLIARGRSAQTAAVAAAGPGAQAGGRLAGGLPGLLGGSFDRLGEHLREIQKGSSDG
jgi:DNA-binding transcriptional ArsR family regulator